MEDIREKLEELANEIIYIHSGITLNESIKSFNKGLEIITYIKSCEDVSDDEYLALRKLTEELIKQGIDGSVINIRSYKRNRISDLTAKIKEELETIPYIEEKEPKIETVNDWIKSLKIFKLKGCFLASDYYQTSYDLYQDIRNIILTRNPPVYKRIYLGRIIDKIEDGKPKNINLQMEDYELAQLIKLIKDNPDFNYRLMAWSYQKSDINDRFVNEDWKNNLLLLIKK